uniref:Uncharacterized protein n=1 Tax=Candidatus Kentrum sp. FM TaxID=2126340 RepID=A0A450RV04_9GAMM|nr:MAG: hypothetical protein BECKFM1743A_GA0114220_1000338 [Candidatus Kentron sp. FM]VFJ43731.1 MAG: hypothetical protein BECKFM1743C_GA0114222_1000338 [Candidatus Kentron sp. FM]VFK05705.1 MAG: hypothetical protein BECKFM1743B_GA0114221_1000338 [Candidatus Kentron sp. FM]
MQLRRELRIAGIVYPTAKEDVRLDLRSPGRGNFTIQGETLPNEDVNLVQFRLGYPKLGPYHLLFNGYVERIEPIDKRHAIIFCRELTGILRHDIRFALRHVTLREILAKVSALTGLTFVTPDTEYANRKLPTVYSMGTGYNLMDTIGKTLAIPRYLWQLESDGKVFVGSWADSYWANRQITIPDKVLTAHHSNNTVRFAAIPALRPGVRMNNRYVQRLRFSGDEMEIQWTKQYWH